MGGTNNEEEVEPKEEWKGITERHEQDFLAFVYFSVHTIEG